METITIRRFQRNTLCLHLVWLWIVCTILLIKINFSTALVVDVIEDLTSNSAWEDRCPGGYHPFESYTCDSQSVIPVENYTGNLGYWAQCPAANVLLCQLIYHVSETEVMKMISVDAYFAGNARIELEIRKKGGYATKHLEGLGWTTVDLDISDQFDILEISISPEYHDSNQLAVIDKIRIDEPPSTKPTDLPITTDSNTGSTDRTTSNPDTPSTLTTTSLSTTELVDSTTETEYTTTAYPDTTGTEYITTGDPDTTGTGDTTTGYPDTTLTSTFTTGDPDTTGTGDTTTGYPDTTLTSTFTTGDPDTTGTGDTTTGYPDTTLTSDITTGDADTTGTGDTTTGYPDTTLTSDITTGNPDTTGTGDTTTGYPDTTLTSDITTGNPDTTETADITITTSYPDTTGTDYTNGTSVTTDSTIPDHTSPDIPSTSQTNPISSTTAIQTTEAITESYSPNPETTQLPPILIAGIPRSISYFVPVLLTLLTSLVILSCFQCCFTWFRRAAKKSEKELSPRYVRNAPYKKFANNPINSLYSLHRPSSLGPMTRKNTTTIAYNFNRKRELETGYSTGFGGDNRFAKLEPNISYQSTAKSPTSPTTFIEPIYSKANRSGRSDLYGYGMDPAQEYFPRLARRPNNYDASPV